MRTARKGSSTNIYHIVTRGVGQQLIFESDADRQRYLDKLQDAMRGPGHNLLAWCLMDNHVHALVEAPMEELSQLMRRLGSGYALYFNAVHGRSGHLFQGRFLSEPVEDDAYLATVVRYIHQNPWAAGMTDGCSYRWSSYDLYAAATPPEGAELVTSYFGSPDELVRFHSELVKTDKCLDIGARRLRVSDDDALGIAIGIFGDRGLGEVKALPRDERDRGLAMLKREGLTVRQIQRLTGVSLGVISKA